MHITGLDILTADVGSPGAPRVYVFVRVQTDEGISGIGEPSCVGKEQAVVGAVCDLEHLVLGADPLAIERLLGVMTRTVIWRTGPVLSAAVSGIEHALWDIKSKALGVPVWQLLGGRVRDRIECYAWIHGGEPGSSDDALRRLDEGFRTVKFTPFEGAPARVSTWLTGNASRLAWRPCARCWVMRSASPSTPTAC